MVKPVVTYASLRTLSKVMAKPAGASALTKVMKLVNRNNSNLPAGQRFSVVPKNLRGLSIPVRQLQRIVREVEQEDQGRTGDE
jgi:hypothetical protein